MSERSDQLVLEYLAKVGDAAHQYLPPRRRTAYITELRGRIEDACRSARARDPEQVRRVLRGFGDPAALAARECADPPQDAEAARESRTGPEAPTGPVESAASDKAATSAKPSKGGLTGGFARQVRLQRDPPPWRGGPKRSRPRRIATREGADGGPTPGGLSPGDLVPGLLAAVRRHPAELFAIAVYLVSALVGAAAFLWVIAAVQVGLSRVWDRSDKRVAVGVPIAATVAGMLLWPGEAPYIDEMIRLSLLDTGLVGMRLAVGGCALYLAVRIARTARAGTA
ncbi:hypothetical protein HDA32_000297 [Spinactinospora alkalitolerans]|uniref:Uncharacterized protein n=1 Tax=Spinactinospora alkalitolerans TaxID=687207 RepID=A0A852TPG8_9ACTN|nr:hypothetical protein [Spinactinospora alkalitolerans]NYE45177.1 hypothetical protein [Spinactinospora alkalitolerans]